MDFETWAYPIAIIEDRYQGTYSGGRWLAVAGIGAPDIGAAVPMLLRLAAREGAPNPWGDDLMAVAFWNDPPKWIASGDTPEDAIDALKKKSAFAV